MKTQTNTIENLNNSELLHISGGDGYAPSNPAQVSTPQTPQQAAEEALKIVTGQVCY